MAKFKGPTYGGSAAAAPKFAGPKYDQPTPPNTGSDGGPMEFLSGLLHNFNDSLTFGLYDKGVDALSGGGTRNQDITANANPAARIIGKTLGGIPGGLGIEKGIMSAAPALARNEIAPIIARNAATSGVMSGADQEIRHGSIDPTQLGIDTVLGGALGGVTAGASRYASSGARVRATGTRLTKQEKLDAQIFAAKSKAKGIDLTVPEAVRAVAPAKAGSLLARRAGTYASPKGSQEAFNFDEGRKPGIVQAGKDIVSSLGPRISPFEASRAAGEAVTGVREGFAGAARPFYSVAATKKIAPNMGKKALRTVPYAAEAAKIVTKDRGKMLAISTELGRPVQINDVAFLDATDKQLKAMYNAAEKDPYKQSILADSSKQVRALIDKFAPTHSMGRGIAEAGSDATAALEAGPLGSISKSGNAATQGNALFGATDAATAADASAAISHLPSPVAQGILANSVDQAVTKSPVGFAKDVLPNDYSAGLAARAAGNKAPGIMDTLEAARAVDPHTPIPHNMEPWSPWNAAFQLIRDYGKKGVAKKLHDPKWIAKLGITGPVQGILAQALASGNRVASEGRR